jgi:hypothetical protein
MWDLLKLGIGGYVVERSVEKGLGVWSGNSLSGPDGRSMDPVNKARSRHNRRDD